ncbi:MAG: peptidylprolyl isomerase [Clostridia bacterium]|nr:peptidylprolyl isomerase [Clostridia bacterium]
MKNFRKLLLIILSLLLVLSIFTACGKKDEGNIVVISVEDYGDITVELMPEYAPKTVEHFKELVKKGHYDNTIFHRIMSGFMIQGGGYDLNNLNDVKPASNVKGEFKNNFFSQNTLSHERGVISMARAKDPNSATSQFFIVHEDSTFLDGDYAAFGKVTKGMDVVDKIANSQVTYNPYTGENSVPVKYPVITSIKMK